MAWVMVVALGLSSISCMTTYDTNGRARQTVDPVVAVAGVAAAGLIGYAASNRNRSAYRSQRTNNYYYDDRGYDSGHCDNGGYEDYGY